MIFAENQRIYFISSLPSRSNVTSGHASTLQNRRSATGSLLINLVLICKP